MRSDLKNGDFHAATLEQLQEILVLLDGPLPPEGVRYLEMWTARVWAPSAFQWAEGDDIDYFIWWLKNNDDGR